MSEKDLTTAEQVASEPSEVPVQVEVPAAVDFNSRDHKRSRGAYLIECAFEYFVALLVSGQFLVAVLQDIGMDDATVGIMASLISLAFVFQLFSIFVVQRISNTKVFSIIEPSDAKGISERA